MCFLKDSRSSEDEAFSVRHLDRKGFDAHSFRSKDMLVIAHDLEVLLSLEGWGLSFDSKIDTVF